MPSSSLRVGLNPYGLTYTLGLQGLGTPRENPRPLGLLGYLDLAISVNSRAIEFHLDHLEVADDPTIEIVTGRLRDHGIIPIVSSSPPLSRLPGAIGQALRIGATTVRVGLSTVLEGARAKCADWQDRVDLIRTELPRFATFAAERDIHLALEDHQDFGSEELLAFAEAAGDNVGICFDTGNPLAVGEAPLDFARRVAHRVRHVHLKDYVSQSTPDGFRLIRCAIGDGVIPLAEIDQVLLSHGQSVTATMEPGAMDSRHIRLFQPDWWVGYGARSAPELAACIQASRKKEIPFHADARTPWELGAGHPELLRYEADMLAQGVANLRTMGWL